MKVSVIEPVGGHGGMDYYTNGFCTGLVNSGVDVTLYTCEKTGCLNNPPFAVFCEYNQIFGSDSKLLRGLRYIKGTIRSVYKSVASGTKICHFHFFHVGALEFFNIIWSKLLGIKVVITVHDVEAFVAELSKPYAAKICYMLSDRIIAHNNWIANELKSKFNISSQKISIIPHGNFINYIGIVPNKVDARKRLKIKKNSKAILFFGQIKKVKGLDLLLKAMPEVIKKHPDILLIIAGKEWKDDYSIYKHIIDQYDLNSYCIEKIQYIPNKDVPFYYAAADLVVLPYRQIYQSGVLIMAMSYGKPVLASNLEGMKEIISDNETGFLFESGKVNSLSNRLVEIFNKPDEMKTVADQGHTLIKADYCWSRVGSLTARCYNSLIIS